MSSPRVFSHHARGKPGEAVSPLWLKVLPGGFRFGRATKLGINFWQRGQNKAGPGESPPVSSLNRRGSARISNRASRGLARGEIGRVDAARSVGILLMTHFSGKTAPHAKIGHGTTWT